MTHVPMNAPSATVHAAQDSSRTDLFGMPLGRLTQAAALEIITARLDAHQPTWIVTPNLDILRQYHTRPDLRSLFHKDQGGADLLLADGMPLIWASRIADSKSALPERVAGSAIVLPLARIAAEHHWRLYLLGGAPGAADAAAKILKAQNPGLHIAGTCCPDLGFESDPDQFAAIRQQVVAANPDLIYVALGFPKQEFVIQRLRPFLPHATFIGVGISLSFIAGTVRRAPAWTQRLGLEWLHRLVQEPRRLFKRYVLQDLPFALFRLFPHALARRLRS